MKTAEEVYQYVLKEHEMANAELKFTYHQSEAVDDELSFLKERILGKITAYEDILRYIKFVKIEEPPNNGVNQDAKGPRENLA